MLQRAGRVAVVVMVTAVIAASCGGDEPAETAPPSSTAEPAGSAPSTPPTTDPPVETIPPTTTASPPTAPQADDVEQAVIDGYLAAWNAYHAAAARPTDQALRSAVHASTTGPNLELSLNRLDDLAAHNWAARPNPEAPAKSEVISAVTFLDEARSQAEFIVCERNNELLVEVGAAPDGSDAVVNDDITAREIRLTMALVDGTWMSQMGTTVNVHYGEQECGAG